MTHARVPPNNPLLAKFVRQVQETRDDLLPEALDLCEGFILTKLLPASGPCAILPVGQFAKGSSDSGFLASAKLVEVFCGHTVQETIDTLALFRQEMAEAIRMEGGDVHIVNSVRTSGAAQYASKATKRNRGKHVHK